jgi:hypothetical protein
MPTDDREYLANQFMASPRNKSGRLSYHAHLMSGPAGQSAPAV